jgi:flagellar biosynthesis protein FlhA
VPFLGLGALAASGAWFKHKSKSRPAQAPTDAAAGPVEPPITESLKVDMVRIELGYGLLSLAGASGSRLTEQIKALRRSIATEMGFVLPPVRIQDNLQLAADRYVLRVKELDAGNGELRPTRLLAMSPQGGLPSLAGEAGTDPVFGLPALWIDPELKEQALFKGCTVVDPSSVLTTHLTEVIREAMPELLSYAETQKLLNELPTEHQRLVSDMIPTQYSVSGVQRVLQSLLAERVSIRDLPTILEGINEATASQIKSIPGIVAHVRTRLARQLSEACTGTDGTIPIITLSPGWETSFAESLVGGGEDKQLAMAPTRLTEFTQRLRVVLDTATAAGESPVLLTGSTVRAHVRAIVERLRPAVPVLAQTEISRRSRIRMVGTI